MIKRNILQKALLMSGLTLLMLGSQSSNAFHVPLNLQVLQFAAQDLQGRVEHVKRGRIAIGRSVTIKTLSERIEVPKIFTKDSFFRKMEEKEETRKRKKREAQKDFQDRIDFLTVLQDDESNLAVGKEVEITIEGGAEFKMAKMFLLL